MGHDENVDKLLHAVSLKAAEDRDKVMADAQARVRDIEARTRAEMTQIQDQIRLEAQRAIHQERERLQGQSQMAFRLAHQTVRVRLLKQAFAQARERVATLPQSPQYQDILGGLMAEALGIVGSDALIQVATSDEKTGRAWIRQHPCACTMRAIQAEPGTVLALAADGRRQVDNSLQTRLARAESLCRQEVAAILFGDDTANRGIV